MTTNSTNHSSPTTSTTDVLLPHPLNHVNHNHTDSSKSLKRTRSSSPTSDSNNKKTRKKRNTTDIDQSLGRHLSADKLYVYPWPTDEPHADLHVLQEQICDYLSLKSFKRKYPDIDRRIVDLHEREYLKSQNVVTESQCDLGLTALKLDEVLQLMSVDYPDKCHQFNHICQQKRRTLMSTNNNNHNHKINSTLLSTSISNQLTDNADKTRSTKLSNTIRDELVRSTMDYNTQLQKERLQERKACFDLQTMQIHLPANRQFRLPKHLTQIGSYPLALVPGQYQDSYRKYQSEELKYMPINTALYYYPKPISLVQSDRFSQQTTINDDDEEETSHSNGLVNGSKCSSSQLIICHMCKTTHDNNQDEFIQCTNCQNRYHPICIDMNSDMLNIIKTYSWQCIDCKSCAKCSKTHDEANMMFCDRCDRGYHSYCVGLETIPDGSWQCSLCDPPVSSTTIINSKNKRTRSIQSPKIESNSTTRLSSRRQRDSTTSDIQTNTNSSSMNLVLTRQ